MTFFEGLRGLFSRRSLENPGRPLTDATLLGVLGGDQSATGRSVSERAALNMGAVWRCIQLNSNVPSALPMHVYSREDKSRTASALLDDPHPEMTPLEVWRLTYVHRCMWGNAYIQKIRNRAGEVVELWPITPDRVQVGRYKPTAGNPGGKIFVVQDDWGTQQALTSREIMHLPALGYDGVTGLSPIRAAREAIGMGLAAEEFGARLFGSGSLMSGILQTEQRLDKESADRLKTQWRAKVSGLSNAHDIAILDSGASFQSVSMPNKDTQFIESRRFQVVEMARFFGVPLVFLFETEKSTSWGTGLEQQSLGWVTYDLHPGWLAPTEQRITKELLVGSYAEYSVEGLLRGDSRARAMFYRTMRDVGAYSANDIRTLENRPPVEGGDVHLQPMNYAPLGTVPASVVDASQMPRLPDDVPDDDDSDEEDEE